LKNLPLICPLCFSKIYKKEYILLCKNVDCFHSLKENGFKYCDDVPVLVSPKLDSVCNPDEINSYIGRRSNTVSKIKKLLTGESNVTKKNCEKFIFETKKIAKRPRVLIIGSGEEGNGTTNLWGSKDLEIHGLDVYISNTVDILADAHYLPLENNYYDGVWIQAVLEHVIEPTKVVSEIYRVLKSKGLIYAETPFMQQVHEGAYDFTRYTVLGHRYLFRKFQAISYGGNKGSEVVLSWSLKYFVWSISRSKFLSQLVGLVSRLVMKPFGFLVSKASLYDSPSGVYFFGFKDENYSISHKELIKLYKGNMH